MDEWEEDEPNAEKASIDLMYEDVRTALEPVRFELILEGGDCRLAGVATDGRVFVNLLGKISRDCAEKRVALSKIEFQLVNKLCRVVRVIPLCPEVPLGLSHSGEETTD